MSQQSDAMNAALSKAAKRGFPGLAGSTGFPKGGAKPNSPQFKPVGGFKQGKNPGKMMPKPARPMSKPAKPMTRPLTKTRSQMAAPKTPAQKAFMAPFKKVKTSVRKSMGY